MKIHFLNMNQVINSQMLAPKAWKHDSFRDFMIKVKLINSAYPAWLSSD